MDKAILRVGALPDPVRGRKAVIQVQFPDGCQVTIDITQPKGTKVEGWVTTAPRELECEEGTVVKIPSTEVWPEGTGQGFTVEI